MLCKNCHFWGVDYDEICDYINTIDADNKTNGFCIDIRADDDQGLDVLFRTKPNFGCIHFKSNIEEKEYRGANDE